MKSISILKSTENFNLPLRSVKDVIQEAIGIFGTKKEAGDMANKLGWPRNSILLMQFPLGSFYVVGESSLGKSEVLGVQYQEFRFPLGYRSGKMDVLILRRW